MIQRYMTTHKGKILVIRHHEKLLALYCVTIRFCPHR